MTKGPWKYQKAEGHHHVEVGIEVLDINHESDARLIALVPEMVEVIKRLNKTLYLIKYVDKLAEKIKRAEKNESVHPVKKS
jgi:hypothetical protein